MANLSDTFTDTANVLLDAHTADSGHIWTKHPLSAAATQSIDINGRLKASASDAIYFAGWTPASIEYDVFCDMVILSLVANQTFACARMDTAANTFYGARFTNGTVELQKRVAGTFTLLGSYVSGLTSGTHPLMLQVRDAAKKVFVDGVERISSTDNAITAAGRVGVRSGASTSDSTGIHIDNLVGADITLAGAVTAISLMLGAATVRRDLAGVSAAASTVTGRLTNSAVLKRWDVTPTSRWSASTAPRWDVDTADRWELVR